MTSPVPIAAGHYSHDLLVHDSDEDVVAATQAFVERGLASGGQVLVHSSEQHVDMLRDALGSRPRLSYGLDSDLYLSPSRTLFAYESMLAAEPAEMWVTGTVPLGDDPAANAAWTRYESLINEVLGGYSFHALCTYDTRTLPAGTIAAAKAAHPGVSSGGDRTSSSADYLEPAAFLTDALAGVPDAPQARPAVVETLHSLDDVRRVRRLMINAAEFANAVPDHDVEGFIIAAHEVLTNGLLHGREPVEFVMWVDTAKLTCRVTDSGPGIPDTLSGYHRPEATCPTGLWVARQVCEDIIVSNQPGGGCRVLLSTA
jgi:anti-sigma regulatory factor (Ser/Thr protein kinase)